MSYQAELPPPAAHPTELQKAKEKAQRSGSLVEEAAVCNQLGEILASHGTSSRLWPPPPQWGYAGSPPHPSDSPPPIMIACRTLRGGPGGASAGAAAAGGSRGQDRLCRGSPQDRRAPG